MAGIVNILLTELKIKINRAILKMVLLKK
jgi:hypothetical protein